MSFSPYPPATGIPAPPWEHQGPPASASGYPGSHGPASSGGIGFEGIGNSYQPSGAMPMPGYPGSGMPSSGAPVNNGMGSNMPYPSQGGYPGTAAMPGTGMSNPNPPPGVSFAGAAYASTAFRSHQSTYPAPSYGNPYDGQQHAQGGLGGSSPYPTQYNVPTGTSGPSSFPGSGGTPTSVSSQYKIPGNGTVKDFSPFNPQQDAELLRKAMKGFGCDDKAVIYLICTRSNQQRRQTQKEFQTMYGKHLIKELESELSGNFETLIRALMAPPDEFDAFQLRTALKGFGTDEAALIEILCTRSNAEIRAASTAFKRLYGRDLEKEVYQDTSGHFRRLLVSLVQGSRDEASHIDHRKAAEDARALYQAGEARWGTDESRFNAILASRSLPQLTVTFQEYEKISKHSMEKAIQKEMSGDLRDGMLAIVKCVKNRPGFFAECLHKSMKGLGTDDRTLIRVIVTRSEVDMVQIKEAFKNMYGQTLARFITDDTSGSYRKALLQLIGGQ